MQNMVPDFSRFSGNFTLLYGESELSTDAMSVIMLPLASKTSKLLSAGRTKQDTYLSRPEFAWLISNQTSKILSEQSGGN